MTRNLKALGLALMAAFALSALYAGAAQAEPGTIKADVGVEEAHLTGTTTEHNGTLRHTFTNPLGTITCEETTFSGTVKNGATDLTIVPTYHTCTFHTFLGQTFTATVNVNGCTYTFTGGNATAGQPDHFDKITVKLLCPGGVTGVSIKVYKGEVHGVGHEDGNRRCEYIVHPFVTHQLNTTATNTAGSPDDVDVTSEVPNVKVKRVFGTALQCGAESQEATYRGGVTLRAYKDSKHTEQTTLTLTDVG